MDWVASRPTAYGVLVAAAVCLQRVDSSHLQAASKSRQLSYGRPFYKWTRRKHDDADQGHNAYGADKPPSFEELLS